MADTKVCRECDRALPITAFHLDRTRADGRTYSCGECRNAGHRASYSPRGRPKGRRFVPARDGDQLQARRRVNHLVDIGLLPDPDDVACTDCGHQGDGRRHEYDHHLGYAADHHEHVEAVCTSCHHRRENQRRR